MGGFAPGSSAADAACSPWGIYSSGAMPRFFSSLPTAVLISDVMKRFYLFILACVAALSASAITLNGVEYNIDTLSMFPAGPGSMYYELRMLKPNGGGRLDCWLLKVNTQHPYVSLREELGSGKIVGTERPSAMAARKTTDTEIYFGGSNGDFFATSGNVGCPISLTVQGHEYAYIGNNGYHVGAVDSDNRPFMIQRWNWNFAGKVITPSNAELSVSHVNLGRGENELVLYNRHNGASTNTNAYGTELLVSLLPGNTWKTSGTMQMVVESKEVSVGNMRIPAGKAVLSGHGTMSEALQAMSAGDTLTLNLALNIDGVPTEIKESVGADNYVHIVKNGVVPTSGYWDELHPRTAFGTTADRDTALFLVVDGRGVSIGCNTRVLGEIIKHYGAYNAVNWDGGGSSCLYIRKFGEMNNGSDGQERACGDGMFAVATVPAADNVVSSIAPYKPIYSLPRYGIASPKFLGYNQYGVLIDTLVQGVTLSCDPSVGEIMPDGRFLASGPAGGILHATYGNYTVDLDVRLMASAPIAIRLDSVLRDGIHPYTVQVQGKVGNAIIDLLAAALEWTSLNPDIASVDDNGSVLGLQNGYADIVGTLGDFSDTIRVKVEIPETHALLWNDFKTPDQWNITASSGFNPSLVVAEDSTLAADLQFTYKTIRNPFIRFGYTFDIPLYSLPDTLRLTFTSDAAVDKVAIGLRANNASAVTSFVSTGDLKVGERNVVDVPIADLLGTDPAIFPVHMDYVRFPLLTTTTAGQHHLYMEGIELIYSDVEDPVSALDEVHTSDAVKQLVNGQIVIRKGDRLYNALGQELR